MFTRWPGSRLRWRALPRARAFLRARARSLVLASCVCPLPAASGPPPVLCCLFFPPVSAWTTERASAPSPLPPPSPCRARDQASPFVGCPPPPWAATALGGPGPGRSAVGPTRVSEGRGGERRERKGRRLRASGVRPGRGAAGGSPRVRESVPGAGRAAAAGGRAGGPSARVCPRVRRGGGPGRRPGVPRDRPCAGGLGRWDPVRTPVATWLCPLEARLVGNPWGSLAVGPRSCFPVALRRRLVALAARRPCRGLLRSATKPGGALWCVGASQARCGLLSVSAATVRPGGGVVCRRGGSSVPLPPPCPPHPPLWRARAWAWGGSRLVRRWLPRDRAPAPPVEGCPGLGPAPAPRERVRRPAVPASARPVRGSVPRPRAATGLLGVGARRRGGTCACPPPPLHAVAGVGPVPRGRGRSVRHARSLAAGWDGARLEWARRARLLRLSLPAGLPRPGGEGGPPPPPPPARRHRPAASRPRAPYARSTVRRVPPPGARSLWLTALLPG